MTWTNIRRGGRLLRAVRLSRREAETLRLRCQGLSRNEIAEAMKVSSWTVHSYLARLRRELGVADLQRWGLQHPAALAGLPDDIEMHPKGCQCDAPYCSTMRTVQAALDTDTPVHP